MTDNTFSDTDKKWMSLAVEIARKGAGYVSPNPMVGCVIVSKEGKKIGQGFHERYGEAHAETNAIESVRDPAQLKGSTMYVTLEPCNHHGTTPPCSEMICKTPVDRIVIAMRDPNKKVKGNGIERLNTCGKKVEVGLMEKEAKKLNEFFIHYTSYERPFVTLKIAQTADGYIAAPDGDSKWITGEPSRQTVHKWRAEYDAVMIGRNTALLDNPRLTVRHTEGRQPYRIVIDGPLELSRDLNIFSDQYEEKTIIITHNRRKLENDGDPMLSILQSDYFRGKTILVPEIDGHCDLESTMKELADLGIISVLVEAGPSLATAALNNNVVDKLELFIAPKLLGGGTRSVVGLDRNRMREVLEFRKKDWNLIGEDLLLTAYL